MQNEIFDKPHRRHIKEINIVPILDMLTTVIFFLLLSATFVQYSKVTVPPSRVSISTDPVKPPPVQPRLSLTSAEDGQYTVILNWSGTAPGRKVEMVKVNQETDPQLASTIENVLKQFKEQYPSENTLQMGLGADLSYQALIVAMDSAKNHLPDIVLYSYLEAEAEGREQNHE